MATTNKTGLQVPRDSEPPASSASTLAGDRLSEKADPQPGSVHDGEDDVQQEKKDAVASAATADAVDDNEYPTGIKMVFIVIALVMSIFLLALDMVSFPRPPPPRLLRSSRDLDTVELTRSDHRGHCHS